MLWTLESHISKDIKILKSRLMQGEDTDHLKKMEDRYKWEVLEYKKTKKKQKDTPSKTKKKNK